MKSKTVRKDVEVELKTLKNDKTIKDLPSDKKIDLYRKAGHSIGENVHIVSRIVLCDTLE